MMEAKRLTTQRKRSACGQLRTLAVELAVKGSAPQLDMTTRQFWLDALDPFPSSCASWARI